MILEVSDMEIGPNIIPVDIKKAHRFAMLKHKNQFRKFTDEPYINHPEQVVGIVSMYINDTSILAASMLHDVVEDTNATIQEIYEIFGDRIGLMVEELTDDEKQIQLLGKRNYTVQHVNSMSNEAFIIKLADRLHNIIGLNSPKIPNSFIKYYLNETKYLLNNLDRDLTELHIALLEVLTFMVEYTYINLK